MSAGLAVTNLIFGDVLTEVGMKPRWETYRGFAFALSLAAALLMTDILLPAKLIQCLPVMKNSTVSDDYSETKSNFVNIYCARPTQPLQYLLEYSGLIATTLAGTIFLISTSWVLQPDVIKAFQTFRRMEERLDELRLTVGYIKVKMFRHDAMTEQQRAILTELLKLLWSYSTADSEETDLKTKYGKRNLRLVILLCISCLFPLPCIYFVHLDDGTYECNMGEYYLKFNHSPLGPIDIFSCSHNLATKLLPFFYVFAISSFIQISCVCFALHKARNFKIETKTSSEKGEKDVIMTTRSISNFVEMFWNDSRPISNSRLWDFVNFALGCSAETKSKYEYQFAGGNLQSLAEDQAPGTRGIFLQEVLTMIQKNDFTTRSPEHAKIKNALNVFQYDTEEYQLPALVYKLTVMQFNELLSCLFNRIAGTENNHISLDRDLKHFAIRKVYDKRHWILFVEMLNSFGFTSNLYLTDFSHDMESLGLTFHRNSEEIQYNRSRLGNENHQTESPEESELTNQRMTRTGNLLYYALTKPEYREDFVLTAAKYILQHTREEDRKVVDEQGNRYTLHDFITDKKLPAYLNNVDFDPNGHY